MLGYFYHRIARNKENIKNIGVDLKPVFEIEVFSISRNWPHSCFFVSFLFRVCYNKSPSRKYFKVKGSKTQSIWERGKIPPPPPAFKESTKTTTTTAAHMSLKVKAWRCRRRTARYELVTVVCFADTDIDFTIEITKVVCITKVLFYICDKLIVILHR